MDAEHHHRVRIIPAYAGSTGRRATQPRPKPDHPRIRGEHTPRSTKRPRRRGSSPHTRGAPALRPVHGRRPGIIPAYAGSTKKERMVADEAKDHPRIRGEHSLAPPTDRGSTGSSPHTRGARSGSPGDTRTPGIIPAYAGSTLSLAVGCALDEDHPRIRGEHIGAGHHHHSAVGSSPHTRGARLGKSRILDACGIIPAYAGSTEECVPHHSLRPDHPRIRGEHAVAAVTVPAYSGSSPHTRGAPLLARADDCHVGIIPAYAGSTASSTPTAY